MLFNFHEKTKFSFSLKTVILFTLSFLITSCGGGITLDATDGSKIKFKNENVSCITGPEYQDIFNNGVLTRNVSCTANGVRTFLTGDRTNFSQPKLCKTVNSKGKVLDSAQENSFGCLAALKFKKI